MSKILSLALLSLFILVTGIFDAGIYGKSTGKRGKNVICKQITPPMMTGVKVSKKKLENGILITMKSKKPDRVELLKRVVVGNLQQAARLETAEGHENELLYVKGIQSTITEEPGGIQIQMISEDAALVKVIKKVYIPSPPYMSGFKPGEMRSGSGQTSGEN